MGEILTPIAFQIELLRLTDGTLAANKRRGHPADIAKGRKAAERAEKALDAHDAALRAEVERLLAAESRAERLEKVLREIESKTGHFGEAPPPPEWMPMLSLIAWVGRTARAAL
ncbi:MAG: hypothetical protein RBU36_17530, partial [Thermoanaerobaculia bacterium]|nr:hypothetical protein [Thermoanaerobaculia bacterium]